MLLAGCGGNAEQADVSAASINAHPGKGDLRSILL